MFFFFQAEDGIRDYKVTGVQTCALPISSKSPHREASRCGDFDAEHALRRHADTASAGSGRARIHPEKRDGPGSGERHQAGGRGAFGARPATGEAGCLERRGEYRAYAARTGSAAAHRGRQIEQGNSRGVETKREHRVGAPREHHGCVGDPQDRGAGGVCHPEWVGEFAVRRREFLAGSLGASLTACVSPSRMLGTPVEPSFHLMDVTEKAGIQFKHNSGAYGGKLLPETLGSGCAFLDYDGDGWQDILLVNGMDWPGHKPEPSAPRLYKTNRN